MNEIRCWHRASGWPVLASLLFQTAKENPPGTENAITEHVTESCLYFSAQVSPAALETARHYACWEDASSRRQKWESHPFPPLCAGWAGGAPGQVGASTRPPRKNAITASHRPPRQWLFRAYCIFCEHKHKYEFQNSGPFHWSVPLNDCNLVFGTTLGQVKLRAAWASLLSLFFFIY